MKLALLLRIQPIRKMQTHHRIASIHEPLPFLSYFHGRSCLHYRPYSRSGIEDWPLTSFQVNALPKLAHAWTIQNEELDSLDVTRSCMHAMYYHAAPREEKNGIIL
jgi:hypothetical protein